jgi:hypothetical protein
MAGKLFTQLVCRTALTYVLLGCVVFDTTAHRRSFQRNNLWTRPRFFVDDLANFLDLELHGRGIAPQGFPSWSK